MTKAAATHKLDQAGFDVTVAPAAYSESVPKGRVLSTDPDPGARVLDHGTIALTLSLGKERYDVPKLKGLDVDHAQDALLTSHLTYGRSIPRWSDTVPRGTVMASDPNQGTRQRPKTVVDLVVSRGPQPVHVADWTGKSAGPRRASPHQPAAGGADDRGVLRPGPGGPASSPRTRRPACSTTATP